jgi:tRNA(Met) C34 N-acetyltransferase TmcA
MGFREARMNLDVDLEAKLIARCLQARSWGHVARVFKTQPASLKAEVGSNVAKILDFYGI